MKRERHISQGCLDWWMAKEVAGVRVWTVVELESAVLRLTARLPWTLDSDVTLDTGRATAHPAPVLPARRRALAKF